ncbi:glycine zipper family protein [Salipiger sp. P9]|uniref:glycine zipper family protein n=1 Tax=Salipiger pentaromativorans TaxID=2943193 RepID=UPI00215809C9|nr:glycine zipper family protein [Salipiger pentaromativorans]MCR8549073.1 glycine zipper family protein [Salipiger pentaromativorans]
MRRLITLIAASSTLGLGACIKADTDLERAAVGAVIGCAAGEVLVEGRCVEGAIVGAGVGVLTN